MLARSFFIKSSSKLLVTRTGIKARTSLILSQIKLLSLELLALKWWHTFKLEYLWSQLANLDQILCVLSLGVGKRLHKVQIGSKLWCPWQATEISHWLIMRKMVSAPFLGYFWSEFLFLYLQITRTCIKSRMSSNFGQIGPLTMELDALEHLKKFPIDL